MHECKEIDGDASWFLLPSVNLKHLLLHPRYKKAKKGQASTLITATTNFNLPKSVSIDPKIKSDSVLTNPKGKDGA